MKRKPRALEIFSLSFLDIISCGFGAVVLLVLISNNAEAPGGTDTAIFRNMLNQVMAAQAQADERAGELAEVEAAGKAKVIVGTRLAGVQDDLRRTAEAAQARLDRLAGELAALSGLRKQMQQAAVSTPTAKERDAEVGGIPVDSDYVVFIVDTSGSMQDVWDRVVQEISNIISIHPKVQGFQILNDNGAHLISAYEGRWIPDTPRLRRSAIDLLSGWQSLSNSSPVEGLEVALERYVTPGEKVSIYIFGDDYSGGSFDPVIRTLDRLNEAPDGGGPMARVHGIGFGAMPMKITFATLMREVTRRNRGSFVALPP